MAKIVIPYAIYPEVLEYLRNYAQVDCFMGRVTQGEMLETIHQYDAIINRGFVVEINEELVRRGKNLKVIGLCKVGLDDVAVDTARNRGIEVINAGDASVNAVVEITLLHLLDISRRYTLNKKLAAEGRGQEKSAMGSFSLEGRTIGIVGFGKIGRKVAQTVSVLGMNVLVYDPFIDRAPDVSVVTFDEILTRSDYVSIHCPLTQDTRNLFDKSALARMKEGSYLINTSRGGLVDEDALYEMLLSGHLAGAGLDVLAKEPMEKGYKLSRLGNVTMTPHIGDLAENTQRKLAMHVAEEVLRKLNLLNT